MAPDLLALQNGFDRYLAAVLDPALPGEDRRIDLKHMRFWYPYYADVVTAITEQQKPFSKRAQKSPLTNRYRIKAATLVVHLRMHWEYLEKLAKNRKSL